MKEAYLPEKHTDFIVSIIGEELGFVAVVSVILLYLLLGASAFGISAATPDATGQLAASGLGLMLWLPSVRAYRRGCRRIADHWYRRAST